MGQGASYAMEPVQQWIETERIKYPRAPPSSEEIQQEYAKVVQYAYKNSRDAKFYLTDLQKRFFNDQCKFLWNWANETPETPLSSLVAQTPAPDTAGEAVEAYRKVCDAISRDPGAHGIILQDMKLRYFDPRFYQECPSRTVTDIAEFRRNLEPVFR